MLGGELSISELSIWLEQPTSYYNHPVTCHVSAIQNDARLSLCNLPGYPDHLWSNDCNAGQAYVRGWVSVRVKTWVRQVYDMIIRRARPIWYPYVRCRARRKRPIPNRDDLDVGHCMGDPCTVSCSLDYYKTLPWTATNINRMGSWGLLHDIDPDTRIFFARWGRNLNIVIFSRSHSWHTSFFVVSCRHFLYLSPKILVCHLWLTRLHPTISHYFYRTQIRLALKSSLILLQLPMSCRCLWLDHASSLAFETIRLNSWPTPTRELPWVQLLSSADKFQLAVVCSVEDARIVHTRGVPHGKHMNFGWFRSSSYVFIASNTVFRSMYIIITGDSLWFIPSQAIFDVPSFCTFLKLLDLHLNGNLLTVKECHRVHCSTFNWRHQECCTREISTPSDSFVERLR